MLLIAIVFVVLMVAGMPVAFATGIAGFVFFVFEANMPLSVGVQKIASMSQSFPLLAVPFFVLAGHLMNESGITSRLLKISMVAVGWISGGLAQVAILLSTLMGGVSGSAVADAAMEARILGPAMIAKGYGKGYSAAAIAVGSLITATIPPSIGLILYGYVGNVSIGRLFMAGIIPGLLMMVVLMITAYLIARKRRYVVANSTKPTFGALARAAWDAKWAILFPVALVFAIRGGVFTPSEVGSFAVFYALAVGFLAHRELSWKKVYRAFAHASTDVGLIMLIILMSGMIGFATIYLQVPQNLAKWMLTGITDPTVITLVILLFLLDRWTRARLHGDGAAAHADLRADHRQGRHGPRALRHPDDEHRHAGRHDVAQRVGHVRRLRADGRLHRGVLDRVHPLHRGDLRPDRRARVLPRGGAVAAQACVRVRLAVGPDSAAGNGGNRKGQDLRPGPCQFGAPGRI